MESTAASVSDDDQASPRSVVGGPAPSERSEGEEVAPSNRPLGSRSLGGFVRGGVPRASRRNVARGARGDAKKFCHRDHGGGGRGCLPRRRTRPVPRRAKRGVDRDVPRRGSLPRRDPHARRASVSRRRGGDERDDAGDFGTVPRPRRVLRRGRRSERARRYAGTRTTMRSPTHTARARARGDRGDGGGRRSRRTTRSARSTRGDERTPPTASTCRSPPSSRTRPPRRNTNRDASPPASAARTRPARRSPRPVRRCGRRRARGGGGRGAPGGCHLSRDSRAGGDASCVGSRPGHCGPGTPLLAMCVSALEVDPRARARRELVAARVLRRGIARPVRVIPRRATRAKAATGVERLRRRDETRRLRCRWRRRTRTRRRHDNIWIFFVRLWLDGRGDARGGGARERHRRDASRHARRRVR